MPRHLLLVGLCALGIVVGALRVRAQEAAVPAAGAATRPATAATRPAATPAAKDNSFAGRVLSRMTAALDQLESDGDFRKAAITICVLFDAVTTRAARATVASNRSVRSRLTIVHLVHLFRFVGASGLCAARDSPGNCQHGMHFVASRQNRLDHRQRRWQIPGRQ